VQRAGSRKRCEAHTAPLSRGSSSAPLRTALSFEEMYRRCGVPMSDDLLAAVAAMDAERSAAANAVIDEMEAEGRRTLELLPGTMELAQWLNAHGVRTALVTRNSAQTVRHLNAALWGPAGLPPLEPAISRDDDLPPKPHPDALHSIAAEWDVPLGAGLLMVGDSPSNDIAFGKAAGVVTALLDTGRAHAEASGGKPAGGGADYIVESLADLPALLAAHYRVHPVRADAPPMSKCARATLPHARWRRSQP
jgi:phosphoglycolate phosphatase-like HAD superfamily hydrolase